jgi:hypothetical protein
LLRFDGQTGEFREEKGLWDKLMCRQADVNANRLGLQQIMQEVKEAAAADLVMLQRASETVVGMIIIQQFILDLLGRNTPVATIFNNKTSAE